jgi:hypothetical protein
MKVKRCLTAEGRPGNPRKRVSEQNKTFTRAFCKSGRRLSVNKNSAEARKRQKEMREPARAAEMAEEEVALEKRKGLAEKEAARKAATGQAGKVERATEEAKRWAATGQADKVKQVWVEAKHWAATGQAESDKHAAGEAARKAATEQAGTAFSPQPRRATARGANRAAQFAPRNRTYTPRQLCNAHPVVPVLNPPFSAAAFVVNSEPHTGARPSVRLCMGPELARCVHRNFPPP